MKKFFVLIFALIIILTAIPACGDTGPPSDGEDTKETTPLPVTVEMDSELSIGDKLDIVLAGIPDQDYDGYTFTVLDRGDPTSLWYTRDVLSEGVNGEPINDAVYERNRLLEESLNIVIAENSQQNPATTAQTLILAGEDSFDVVTSGLASLGNLSKAGFLVDLYELPGLNLYSDWWDINIVTEMSIAKKLFFATGDISIMDNYGTWAVTFNKGVISELNLEDPYTLFAQDKWLFPKMHEMCIDASADLDGDGVMGLEDRYGSGTEAFNVYAYWAGAGQKIITKDENDLPILTMNNEKSVEVLDKVLEFQNNRNITTSTSRRSDGKYMYMLFRDDYLLFSYIGMVTLAYYRETEVDYGLITAPKYDEEQEDYCNTYSYTNFTAYSVPKTASDLERTGIILDAMAGISKYTLSYAYYDVVLSHKQLRDEESRDMVDLILNTRSYDLGPVFNWGNCLNIITGLYDTTTNTFSSRYAAAENNILTAIEAFIDSLPE